MKKTAKHSHFAVLSGSVIPNFGDRVLQVGKKLYTNSGNMSVHVCEILDEPEEKPETNADALLRLIRENLVDFICWDNNLSGTICDTIEVPDGSNACGGKCDKCLREWLAQPYAGQLAVVDGRIVRTEAGDGRD